MKSFIRRPLVLCAMLAGLMAAAGTLPALYVSGIAVAPRGAWPYGLWGEYATDTAEIQRYATDLRSISQGRGTFRSEFAYYQPVPGHLVDRIRQESAAAAVS